MYISSNLLLDKTNYTSRDFFIKYQSSLSLQYVCYYLYNNLNDTIDQRVYYNEIRDYYKDKYTIEHITKMYDIAIFNRLSLLTCNKIPTPPFCDRNCHLCEDQKYKF